MELTLTAQAAPSPLDVAYQGSRQWRLRPEVEQAFFGGRMTIRELVGLGERALERI